ncbi:MAG: hypothetical protein A3J76_00370 [Candidatus Moranbacteria bacterium RBG_13_45_13]|nr:MAG: hypothetical protein A3J76_00370 [Candidatus Moranbacteria bacterium RBG_13_45_13]
MALIPIYPGRTFFLFLMGYNELILQSLFFLFFPAPLASLSLFLVRQNAIVFSYSIIVFFAIRCQKENGLFAENFFRPNICLFDKFFHSFFIILMRNNEAK